MHPTVSLALNCSKNNNNSFITKCKLKFQGVKYLNKNQGKLYLYTLLQLYQEIAFLKGTNLGEGHHQTIDVYRKIVDIERKINSMEENNKKNRKQNQKEIETQKQKQKLRN
tara:strand:- start:2646 stop:2978 length:333 start_codon:yes stop_codon:yes gene_type:complete